MILNQFYGMSDGRFSLEEPTYNCKRMSRSHIMLISSTPKHVDAIFFSPHFHTVDAKHIRLPAVTRNSLYIVMEQEYLLHF
jgi:hypothetical protein